ncbi:putative nepenthesin [Rosa chinensis]|uniref:Putative nepenthesin n=1 Tax=Rosa chinensis TaxID=74649 RepID=A0A2P6QT31_ROSCH|nr:putative nepenthesin [Rosa chinensis]
MLTYLFLSIAVSLTISLTSMFPLFSLIQANNHGERGFTVELIHRDSPFSPLYNPLETPSKRVANALQRSINHANRIFKATSFTSNWPQSTIMPDTGEYLMEISIGTPPVEILGTADTASDLSWIQCIPCRTSCSNEEICHYEITYGDKSYSNGIVATDTITFGSTTRQPFRLPQIILGCGHNNSGLFREAASGMIGLARGSASLISQMDSTIDGRFSYCQVHAIWKPNSTVTSKMNFGSRAVVSGFRVVSTPLLTGDPNMSFYFLRLEAMNVGLKRFQYYTNGTASTKLGKGNIIIDAGTTLTYLRKDVYGKLESAMSEAIKLERVNDTQHHLNLCYKTYSDIKAPIITAHFTSGTKLKLKALNTFMRLSKTLVCFAFKPTPVDIAIFGNMAQRNFFIGYILKKETVSPLSLLIVPSINHQYARTHKYPRLVLFIIMYSQLF